MTETVHERKKGSLVELSQAWVPPWLKFRSPVPASFPAPASQVHDMPRSPACSPSSQAQGHTHWFSSRSRVKLELKAGMTKLTWARWTGWKWGKGREGVNWGRPEGGYWGIREILEQGIALERGGPSPAVVRIIDLGARCFVKTHLSARLCPFPGGRGQKCTSLGTIHSAHWVSEGSRCHPTSLGTVSRSSKDAERQLSLPSA